EAQMRRHRAALLRHASHVEGGAALAFQMRGHGEDGADGDDAGAADAGDEHVPRPGERERRRLGDRPLGNSARIDVLRPARLHALDGDEGRAEALDAGKVLVARRLVDAALAAELGLDRGDGEAVRLLRAVAAALADQLVDDDAALDARLRVALAAAALLRGAGLVVDDGRHALDA